MIHKKGGRIQTYTLTMPHRLQPISLRYKVGRGLGKAEMSSCHNDPYGREIYPYFWLAIKLGSCSGKLLIPRTKQDYSLSPIYPPLQTQYLEYL